MAAPFVKESKRHQPLLDTSHLIDILVLLKKHGYSGVSYYDLGFILGLLPRTLDVIEESNKGDVSSCLRECLKAWLEQKDNVKSKGGPTYEILIQALRRMGENAVADGIEREVTPRTEVYAIKTVAPILRKHYSILRQATEVCLQTIAAELYSMGLISRDVKSSPTFDKIENEFIALLSLFKEDMTELEKKCRSFVHCLATPGGPAKDAAIALAEDWEREVLNKRNLKWSLSIADEIDKKRSPITADPISTPAADRIPDTQNPLTEGHIVPPTANPISIEDTPAADRIPNTQKPLTEGKIEKWLKEGEVDLKITRINMHGAPGAGKTCSLHLLLNERPPENDNSTPIAGPAVQATRISVDDKNKKWKRVKEEDLLNQLAYRLNEAPSETEHIKKAPIPTNAAPVRLDDSSPKAELSEKELPEKKPPEKKPTDMEVIKKIVSALEAGKFKQLSTNWVYFIDSGGQPAYRELLPLFTRAAALNIITIDLTKRLDEKCKFQYRISQHTSPINTDLKYSNRDIIRSTICSEAMSTSIEIPYVSDMPKHSHYLILGTRKELVTEAKRKDMNESLMNSSNLDLKNVIPNEPGKSIIFPVNTLLIAGSKEREEASKNLCRAVSNCNLEMTIKLPIRLFAFEISMQRKAKEKERSFLTKKEVVQIGKNLLLDESDIDDALQYLHDVTIILYYHEVLPNILFVNPKPILDVLSRLIAITYVEQSKLDLIANEASEERMRLKKHGLFKKDLLEKIKIDQPKIDQQKVFDQNFKSSHMIDLLKHLHIITEVRNKEEEIEYFFPCALPSYDEFKDPTAQIQVIQPLLIAWEIRNDGTTTLAIPQGLFPLTIVHLLEKNDKVGFSPACKGFYRCHDAMSLCVYQKYYIDVINRYTHIEIRFHGCKDLCPQIRELVTDAIKKSSKVLSVNKNHIFAFKCPKNEQKISCNDQQKELRDQRYCIVKEGLCKFSTRCTQCRPSCNIKDNDSYKCWFPSGYYQLLSCNAKYFKKWGCMFMILFAFIIALAGITINHFTVGTTITTDASPAQPHQYSTTVNPDSDHGAGQLSIENVDKVLKVLHEAMFGPAEWKNLGLKLGLLVPTTLDVIEDGGGNAHKKLEKTIGAWLRGEDKVTSRTWQTLIDAVRETGDRAAAERIPDKLKSLYGITLQ